MIEQIMCLFVPGLHTDAAASQRILQLIVLAGAFLELRVQALVAHGDLILFLMVGTTPNGSFL